MHMQRAFIIRPFGKKKDRAGREIDFDHVQTVLIAGCNGARNARNRCGRRLRETRRANVSRSASRAYSIAPIVLRACFVKAATMRRISIASAV
jgi:hypothetical protein